MKAPQRQWIVTPRQLVRRGLLALGLLALSSWMVADLSRQVIKQRKTRQEPAITTYDSEGAATRSIGPAP